MPGNKNSGRKKKASSDAESDIVPSSPSLLKQQRGRPRKDTHSETHSHTDQEVLPKVTDDSQEENTKASKSHVPLLSIRNSTNSINWDQAVGKGIDMIPTSKLPTKRIILRRYRALRVLTPLGDTVPIVSMIAKDVLSIWAMTPTIPVVSEQTVCRYITRVIRKHCDMTPISKRLTIKVHLMSASTYAQQV